VKRLPVDVAELASLLDQARGGPVRAFFDRATGEIDSMPRDAEVEGVYDDIIASPERWVEIRPLRTPERRELRCRFVEDAVTDPQLRLELFDALSGERAFARFESVLRQHAPWLDTWLAFRTRALLPLARAWLSALDVDPERTKETPC
jgi:hypothetical protein